MSAGGSTLASLRARWLDAARRGTPRFPRCGCGAWAWPPTVRCAACGDAIWELASVPGTGIVRAATTVHRGVAPAFADATPFLVGAVDLDAGPVFVTRLADDAVPGARVRLVWRDHPGAGWPWAEPDGGQSAARGTGRALQASHSDDGH